MADATSINWELPDASLWQCKLADLSGAMLQMPPPRAQCCVYDLADVERTRCDLAGVRNREWDLSDVGTTKHIL